MKKRMLCMVLVIFMVLSLLPADASAAPQIVRRDGGKLLETVVVGESYQLTVRGEKVRYYSSKEKVATISNLSGKMKLVGPGTVTITARDYKNNQKVASKSFTVLQRAEGLTLKSDGVNLNERQVLVEMGKQLTLVATKKPATSTDVVRFYSSDKNIVTVGPSNGKVTPKAPGVATITVYAKKTTATALSDRSNIVAKVQLVVMEEGILDETGDGLQVKLFGEPTDKREFIFRKGEEEALELSMPRAWEDGSPYQEVDIRAYPNDRDTDVSYSFDDGLFRPDTGETGTEGYQRTTYILRYTYEGKLYRTEPVVVTVVDTDENSDMLKLPKSVELKALQTECEIGDTVTWSADYVGFPSSQISYQWQKKENGSWVDIATATGPAFQLPTDTEGSVAYRCGVTEAVEMDERTETPSDATAGEAGKTYRVSNDSPEATLRVTAAVEKEHLPLITESMVYYVVKPEQKFTLTVDAAAPQDGEALSHAWFFNYKNSNTGSIAIEEIPLFSVIGDAQTGSLTLQAKQPVQGYVYCEVTNITYANTLTEAEREENPPTVVSVPIAVTVSDSAQNTRISITEAYSGSVKLPFGEGIYQEAGVVELRDYMSEAASDVLQTPVTGATIYDVKVSDLQGKNFFDPLFPGRTERISLPMPADLEDENPQSYDFALVHAILDTDNKVSLEKLPVTLDTEAKVFHANINSASPFLLAWSAKSSGEQNSGGYIPSVSERAMIDIKNAKSGDTVLMTLPSYSTTVDKAVFEALRGKDVTLKITVGDRIWTINGKDIPIDVKGSDYFFDPVMWAVSKDITYGTSATTFSPEAVCTRAQAVTLLWRAAGRPKVEVENPFTDVKKGSYYYDAVLWAVEKGITRGTSATTFGPKEVCTRAQMVTFLYRYAGSPAVSGDQTFDDVEKGRYYYDAVRWVTEQKVTRGTGSHTFSPGRKCTRGQGVTFLFRWFNR